MCNVFCLSCEMSFVFCAIASLVYRVRCLLFLLLFSFVYFERGSSLFIAALLSDRLFIMIVYS